MFQPNNVEYYTARASASRQMARKAVSPDIASIHEVMALRYERIITELEQAVVRPIRGSVQIADIGRMPPVSTGSFARLARMPSSVRT